MSSPTRELTLLADGYSFLEGPRWRDGHLYVSDFYTHRVLRFDEQGGVEELCRVEGRPSGLGFEPDGSLLVVSMTDRRLLRLRDGALEQVADLSALATGDCNDLLVDPAGRAYVGNFGASDADLTVFPTRLVRVDPDGSLSIAAEGLNFPNGSTLSPDGRTLLVSETFAGQVSAFDVAADGRLGGRRVWAAFGPTGATITAAVASGTPLPDGMALDADGAIWLGDAAGFGALRVTEGGAIVDRVDTRELAVFAVALGGADRRTLFLCASPPLLSNNPATDHRARLYSCRVDVPGAGLP